MAINDVIGLELDNKCMPNRINELGVHDDVYVYICVMHAMLVSSLARVLSCVEGWNMLTNVKTSHIHHIYQIHCMD